MRILAIITGVLTAIPGIYGLTVPFRIFGGLGWVVGVLFMVNGIESIVVGFFNKAKKDVWLCIPKGMAFTGVILCKKYA